MNTYYVIDNNRVIGMVRATDLRSACTLAEQSEVEFDALTTKKPADFNMVVITEPTKLDVAKEHAVQAIASARDAIADKVAPARTRIGRWLQSVGSRIATPAA